LPRQAFAAIFTSYVSIALSSPVKNHPKGNLFEKVQIPGYQEAILKIKRYLEDEENLSKSSQKIMRTHQEQRRKEEEGIW